MFELSSSSSSPHFLRFPPLAGVFTPSTIHKPCARLLPASVTHVSNHFLRPQSGDVRVRISQLRQNLIGVLAEQGRACNHGRAVAHLDWIAHRQIFSPLR